MSAKFPYFRWVSLAALGLTAASLAVCDFVEDGSNQIGLLRGFYSCDLHSQARINYLGIPFMLSRGFGFAAIVVGFLATFTAIFMSDPTRWYIVLRFLLVGSTLATFGMLSSVWFSSWCLDGFCKFGWGSLYGSIACWLWLTASVVSFLPSDHPYFDDEEWLSFPQGLRWLLCQACAAAAFGLSVYILDTCNYLLVDDFVYQGLMGNGYGEPDSCQPVSSTVRSIYPYMEVARICGVLVTVVGGLSLVHVLWVQSCYEVHGRSFAMFHAFSFFLSGVLQSLTHLVHLVGDLCQDYSCELRFGAYCSIVSAALWGLAALTALCIRNDGSPSGDPSDDHRRSVDTPSHCPTSPTATSPPPQTVHVDRRVINILEDQETDADGDPVKVTTIIYSDFTTDKFVSKMPVAAPTSPLATAAQVLQAVAEVVGERSDGEGEEDRNGDAKDRGVLVLD